MEQISAEVAVPNDSSSSVKPSWRLATREEKEDFPSVLQKNLAEISIPEEVQNCRNVKCKDLGHCDKADEFIHKLMECVEKSAEEALPLPMPNPPRKSPGVKPVPGWSHTVKPFCDKVYFWHQVWISAGNKECLPLSIS